MKAFKLLLSVILIFTFCSCGNNSDLIEGNCESGDCLSATSHGRCLLAGNTWHFDKVFAITGIDLTAQDTTDVLNYYDAFDTYTIQLVGECFFENRMDIEITENNNGTTTMHYGSQSR